MRKKAQATGFGLLFFGIILATALAGGEPVGYHEECVNGIDDDSDAGIDGGDDQCFEYPFADGNGESPTSTSQRYTNGAYQSLFEYHRDYSGDQQATEGAICFAGATGMYSPQDEAAAQAWIEETGTDCSGQGP